MRFSQAHVSGQSFKNNHYRGDYRRNNLITLNVKYADCSLVGGCSERLLHARGPTQQYPDLQADEWVGAKMNEVYIRRVTNGPGDLYPGQVSFFFCAPGLKC